MKRITTLVGLVMLLAAMAVPAAFATQQEADEGQDHDYVLAVWETVKAYPDHFEEPQTLHDFMYTSSTSLDQLDGTFECGSHYQVDLYGNSDRTAALLDGGTLRGPNDPKEDLALRGEGTGWKYVSTDDCLDEEPVDCSTDPASGDIESFLTDNDLDCLDVEIVEQCGEISGTLTRNNNFDTDGDYQLQWNEGDTIDLDNAQPLPATFGEDTGTRTVTVFVAGPESDYITTAGEGDAQFAFPNGGVQYDVDTDCQQQPQVEVAATEWVDGAYECDDTTVEQTREVTTTTTTFVWVDGEFVVDEVTDVTETEIRTRDLTDEDFAELDCADVLGVTIEADPAPGPTPKADPVVMDETEVKGAQLANAGFDSMLLLIMGSGLLALGGSILFLADRRRRGLLG